MEPSTPANASRPLRPDVEPFNLGDALSSICAQVRSILGWRFAALLIGDETTGLSCLVAESGIPQETREILLGAAIGSTDELFSWLETTDNAGGVYVIDHFASGTPLGIEMMLGGEAPPGVEDGYAAIAPVRIRGRAVGMLAVYGATDEPRPDAGRVALLRMVATSIETLIDQSTSADRATRRLENGQLLARLSNRILHHRDFDQILDVTLGDISSHLETDLCAAFRARQGRLEVVQESAKSGVTRSAAQLPVAIALGESRQAGVSVFEEGDGTGGIASSLLIAPIHVRDELHAVIVCASIGEARVWQPYEIELMRGVADQLGLALSEAWLQAEQEGSRRDLESLLGASRALAQANDLDAVIGDLLQLAQDAISSDACAVLLTGESSGPLRVLAHRGCDPQIEGLKVAVDGVTVAAESYRNGAVVTASRAAGKSENFVLGEAMRSAIAAPLRLGEAPLGVLVLESTRDRAFAEREAKLVGALAREAAVAIHRTQLFDRVALGKREWEATFDAMADAVFLLDRDGRVVRANRAAGRLFEVEPNDLRGATCCSLICDRTTGHECTTRRALDEGFAVANVTRIGDIEFDLTVDPIRNRIGMRTGAVAVLRRTDRSEHADDIDLHVSRAFARSTTLLLLLDSEGLVRWANAAAEQVFGETLIPLAPMVTMFVDADRDVVVAALRSAHDGESGPVTLKPFSSDLPIVVNLTASRDGANERVIVVQGVVAGSIRE